MKAKRKLLLGIGLVVVPITLATVATACSTNGEKDKTTPGTSAEKTAANDELKKVKLDFGAKATTLASTITASSTFSEDGFTKDKYELKVTKVEQGTDKTSVTVTFHLVVKDSKANPKTQSDDKTITITGFKNPVTPTPGGGGTTPTPQKAEVEKELKNVKLMFNDPSNTLASDVTKTSSFTKSGFDTNKYEVEVTNVVVGEDKTSVTVTFHLVSKDSTDKTVSSNSTVVIKGFKTPPTPTPKPEPQPVSQKVKETTEHLEKFAKESLKNITLDDVFGSGADLNGFLTAAASEFDKTNPVVKIDTKKREITVGNKSIILTNKIFDHVKVGLAHLFNTHGGKIQHLVDVFQSKKDSAEELFKDKAVLNFVEFLKNFATVESDWKETLTTTLNSSKGFEFKIDFDKLEISAKTSENTYKKVITFHKDFVDGLKKSISTIIKDLLSKEQQALVPVIETFINSKILKGTWIVKHDATNGLQISKESRK